MIFNNVIIERLLLVKEFFLFYNYYTSK